MNRAALALIPLAVVGLWLGSYFILRDLPDRGTLGDMFGAVNALFTGLALAAAAIAVYFQSIELKETRKELASAAESQRETVELQKHVLELQRLNYVISIKLKKAEIEASLLLSGKDMNPFFEEKIDALLAKIESPEKAAQPGVQADVS